MSREKQIYKKESVMPVVDIKDGVVILKMSVEEAAAVAAIIGVSTGSNRFLGGNTFPVYMRLLDALRVPEDKSLYKTDPTMTINTKEVFGEMTIEGMNIRVDVDGNDI